MLIVMSMGRGLYTQDVPPTPIAVGVGSPVTRPLIDAVMDTVRFKVVIGWNLGAALRQTSIDLNSSIWYVRSPFHTSGRGGDPFHRDQYHEMFRTVSKMHLVVVSAGHTIEP